MLTSCYIKNNDVSIIKYKNKTYVCKGYVWVHGHNDTVEFVDYKTGREITLSGDYTIEKIN